MESAHVAHILEPLNIYIGILFIVHSRNVANEKENCEKGINVHRLPGQRKIARFVYFQRNFISRFGHLETFTCLCSFFDIFIAYLKVFVTGYATTNETNKTCRKIIAFVWLTPNINIYWDAIPEHIKMALSTETRAIIEITCAFARNYFWSIFEAQNNKILSSRFWIGWNAFACAVFLGIWFNSFLDYSCSCSVQFVANIVVAMKINFWMLTKTNEKIWIRKS